MWNKSAEELRAALSAPFQSADIEWRISATNSAKTSGLAVPYRSVRREIAEYEERVTHLIQSGSQSPKIMDRWVMRIQGLKEKKRNYENILKRELTDLDEEFTSLRYLSDELRIRAAGLRVHQKAA